MKTILKSSLVLLTLCLAACSKDKPKEVTLVGEWNPVEEVVLNGNTKEEIRHLLYGECRRKSSLKIEANGQAELTNFAKEADSENCIKDGVIKMTYIYNKEEKKLDFTMIEDNEPLLTTIEKLTENELVFNFADKDENNDGKAEYRIIHFIRKK